MKCIYWIQGKCAKVSLPGKAFIGTYLFSIWCYYNIVKNKEGKCDILNVLSLWFIINVLSLFDILPFLDAEYKLPNIVENTREELSSKLSKQFT